MGFLRSLLNYAGAAWHVVAGIPADVGNALRAVWNFVGSVHTLFSNIIASDIKHILQAYFTVVQQLVGLADDYLHALARIAGWIWGHQVNPVRIQLFGNIIQLKNWTAVRLAGLLALDVKLYWQSLRYAYSLAATERVWRLADVQRARQYAAALVKAALQTVDREAADGYNSQSAQRKNAIATALTDLAERNPVIKDIVSHLIGLLVNVAAIDDPLIRVALNLGLKELISRLGVDKIEGTLVQALINEVTGGGPPRTLQQATAAIAGRLGTLEQQQADFMRHGGPEVEQAGDAWKAYASLGFDVALLGFVGLAVTDPTAFATGVNNSAGTIVNGTVSAVAGLIRKA
jgi:hypothetical protein